MRKVKYGMAFCIPVVPVATPAAKLSWQWYTFEELSILELYAVLTLRQEVFVVEQHCAYLDCDGRDTRAWHLVGWSGSGKLRKPLGYLRVIPPEQDRELPVIGRLLTHKNIRGKRIGESLLQMALQQIQASMPGSSIRISAQHHLQKFYERFGFTPVSDVFLEDGIPHISMAHPGLDEPC